MVFSWSFTEVIRYGFFALNSILKESPFIIGIIRYSTFIVLYPTGVLGESLTIFNV
jgi:very-long-chain (3R)-3-hydroxyacyl-CoA dehydratase